ncbi:MAG: hypothetical protein K9L62_02100 [Vallitaleaceae bacterium]|nr:hypothetical protein [Vallitaleaceae bacterium]
MNKKAITMGRIMGNIIGFIISVIITATIIILGVAFLAWLLRITGVM